jgi:CHAT domain-containing protein
LLFDEDDLLERMARWFNRLRLPAGKNDASLLALRRLYHAIIEPLTPHLPPNGRLVLAPFSWLHQLPLGATQNSLDLRYLAETYELAVAPSLAALRVQLDQRRLRDRGGSERGRRSRLLGVAYPGPGTPGAPGYLNNVVPEAETVACQFSGAVSLLKAAATPDAVLELASDQDVVHFGCHGTFDREHPAQSGLLLAGGWLTIQRILTELRLHGARLATLGACLTGQLAVRQGEEHVGLVQSLLTASAQSVVAALWSVPDAATRALFEAFYQAIAAGRSPAAAMHEAAALVRAQPGWSHPYYWAAFPVSGLAFGEVGAGVEAAPASRSLDATSANAERGTGEAAMSNGVETQAVMHFVDNTIELLEQMEEEPEDTLARLEASGQRTLLMGLRAIARRAREVQTGEQLVTLAVAVHDLVAQAPALVTFLCGSTADASRQSTSELHTATAQTLEIEYVRKRAEVMTVVIHRCEREFAALSPEDGAPDKADEKDHERER